MYKIFIKTWYGKKFFCFCETIIQNNGFFSFVDTEQKMVGMIDEKLFHYALRVAK